MITYLEDVEKEIGKLVSRSTEPIHLITELEPIETKLNNIKYTLERQEREVQESEQRKNDLVVFLAHDLKTPLTSIVAYLSMLQSHPELSEAERSKYTGISLEKAIRLGKLIEEFLRLPSLTPRISFWKNGVEFEPHVGADCRRDVWRLPRKEARVPGGGRGRCNRTCRSGQAGQGL